MRIIHTVLVIMVSWAGVVQARPAEAERGMVVTGHPLATDAAAAVLREGGNAIDAAVAAAFMLGVVDGHNSGLGGGCFMLIHLADGTVVALDGREMAPQAAHRDMYVREGQARTDLSQVGALASGVPGSVAVYEHAVSRYGRREWRELILPAARVAEEGFAIDQTYARRLAANVETIRQFDSTRAILLKEDGRPLERGEVLRQGDLAASYQALAEQGGDWFYRGPFARAVEQWMGDNGGIITAEDFAGYEMKSRRPLRTTYRGYEILGFPPASSGGVHVAQILHILEEFDIRGMHQARPAERVHVIAEAMKLAFADRAHWLGDSDFVAVPRGLIDPHYGRELSGSIRMDQVIAVERHGTPPRAEEDLFGDDDFARQADEQTRRQGDGEVAPVPLSAPPPASWSSPDRHTTHIAAADAEGNFVAITTTLNTAFGSKVIIPGTGVLMNNQMDDFSIQPGVPNVFGLVGAEANAVAPGKRPLSSMSPTIVLKDGRPVMTLGAAGGPRIITQVVLAISNHIDLGDDLLEAVSRQRFHHQWLPDELFVEEQTDARLVEALRQLGHEVRMTDVVGVTAAILFDAERNVFIGVSEPRGAGKAAGP